MMEIFSGLGYRILTPTPDDFQDFARMKAQLGNLVKDGTKNFIMDMKNFQTVDSRGLGLLLQLHKDAAAGGGKMVLIDLSPSIMELINMCRLNNTFSITDSETTAKKIFRS